MVRVREDALNGNNNQIDNNGYFDPNGAAFLDDNLDWQEWSLAQWKAQTFRDLHSFDADPVLDEGYHLLAGSPCINTGVNQTFITTDREGQPRNDGANDIGSDELGTVGIEEEASQNTGYAFQLLQNPVSAQLKIQLESAQKQLLQLEIISQNGKILSAQPWQVQPGENTQTLFVSNLPAGVYMLRAGRWSRVFLKS